MHPMSESSDKPMTLRVPIRVRYRECDPMNVVHHSVYPVWMEVARVELLRAQGAVYAELEKQGILFMVARMSLRYKKPAFYDDALIVEITAEPNEGIKIEHTYRILRESEQGDEVLCTAETTVVCANREGKAQRIPEALLP